jgi:hypothetical protein
MNSKAPVVLAIGVGYLLGRTHKMKWAMALGAAAATGQLNGVSGRLLERGTAALASTPELARLSEGATKLLEAGRGALTAAMTEKTAAVTDRLEGRAGQVQDLGRSATKRRGKATDEDSESNEDEEDTYDEEADEADEYDDQDDEADEDEDEDDDEDEADEPEAEEKPTRRRSPVVRRPRR